MRSRYPIVLAFCLLMGCTSYQVVRIPVRDAGLYPVSQTLDAISVGIDPIKDGRRSARYFGIDLLDQGILPVVITVSNHGRSRAAVNPGNILLRRGNSVVDPLPIEHIISKATVWRMSEETATQINQYLRNLAFQDRVLMAGDTYQGVLFFPVRQESDTAANGFTVLDVFSGNLMKLTVVVTDLGESKRYRFGPFSVEQPYFWPG
ncbi:MAG: hypothetical protein L0H63_05810 [Nitrococcus sp.]|nr:hypothetical protein [Nitrococcus sp.]